MFDDEHTSVQEVRTHAHIPVRSARGTNRIEEAKRKHRCQGSGQLPEQGENVQGGKYFYSLS